MPVARGRCVRDGVAYVATLPVDPEVIRRERAQSDVVVAAISREPVAFEQALALRRAEQITGTIRVRLDPGPIGTVRRRTRECRVETRAADGKRTTETSTEVTEAMVLP
ncbi:hypothetical protein GCM10022280_13730 [Sphingomonas swuensis]|uniref:Uncharacterized protein n=1 Tax=Sphingomonas swuensis TaxID=977800 RepID=A0ABP7SSW0_9SPHN